METPPDETLDDSSSGSSSGSSLRFVCPYPDCNASFARNGKLQTHTNIHTDSRPYICDIDGCEQSFASAAYLKKHSKRPHLADAIKKPKKTYPCGHCQKECKTKYDLKVHETSHTGEKAFKCERCDKAFATRSKLKSHAKVHDGYKCTTDGCSFEADTWTALRKHAVEHKGKKQCPHCHKSYINQQHYDLHLKRHDVSFKCPQCVNVYSTKFNLQSHIQSVHEGFTFECSFEGCTKRFAHKKSLREHLKKHDPETGILIEEPRLPSQAVMAEKLSGEKASLEEKTFLKQTDKLFRQSSLLLAI